jgi:hypothetical protein
LQSLNEISLLGAWSCATGEVAYEPKPKINEKISEALIDMGFIGIARNFRESFLFSKAS